MQRPGDWDKVNIALEAALRTIRNELPAFELPFEIPEIQALAILWPSNQEPPETIADPGEKEFE